MKWLKRIFVALVLSGIAMLAWVRWSIDRQGAASDAWEVAARDRNTRVHFDGHGIPTIEAKTWPEAIEMQGYVIASERLWQMDLIRRSGTGRLAEWFGELALEADRRRKLEDWEEVANRAFVALPPEEREYVDAYTRGVNRFISERPNAWGLEYSLLQASPEPWLGRDTMIVILLMCEQLTASVLSEAVAGTWLEHAGPEWFAFLYAQDHPWNQPMFGVKPRNAPEIPFSKAVPMKPIDDADVRAMAGALAAAEPDRPPPSEELGSNNWAWCGKTGCFLANDPHLGATIPTIWYANRLRVENGEWVVGVSIPGIPGVTLGMNNDLAWAFTNVGEDVDDLAIEKVSPDGKKYLARIENGSEVWLPVEEVKKPINIKGGRVEEVIARFTHRGPLYDRTAESGRWYSRRWLPLEPGRLRAPAALMHARDWDSFNAAIDDFLVPAQNILMVDRKGNMGYRASGTGILRQKTGLVPQPALESEWLGFAPSSTRPRMLFYVVDAPADQKPSGTSTVSSGESRFIATANERIWVDEVGHRWADEQRKERIRRVLASRDDFTRADMEALQRDTESRYRKLLIDWTKKYADADEASKRGADAKKIIERWTRWKGAAIDDAQTFSDAIAIDEALQDLCINRARQAFLPEQLRGREYDHWNRTAWIVTMLETEGGTRVFGLDPKDLATRMLELAVLREAQKKPPYFERNRWATQHPLSKTPVVGGLFAVDTPVQYGWRGVPRVEQPTYGASVRLVWDLRDPANSTWSLPVGQSGHIGSDHYKDLQSSWFAGKPMQVFDSSWK